MAPYEALYDRRCRSPVCWTELNERKVVGPKLIQETESTVKKIRERLRIAFDRQKSYTDLKQRDIEYSIGDKVFLKVSHWKKILRFGLKDPSHVISIEDIEIRPDLSYKEESVKILAHECIPALADETLYNIPVCGLEYVYPSKFKLCY
ncbi:uncharacterized protein [Gossypium hirsutum]|uniref:DNA/RNA polymerases superfamily protein n=1 Tax=Gossypium hirsutum TaxID=3635 RepID=A0A1U8IGD4_GOSHI|nr:uncharacterized protein LOC107894677 [Gossypium hirsutum]